MFASQAKAYTYMYILFSISLSLAGNSGHLTDTAAARISTIYPFRSAEQYFRVIKQWYMAASVLDF